MTACWMCHGWDAIDKVDTGETTWSVATGGERGERLPIYRLELAPGTFNGELIDCPFCKPTIPPEVEP
jgi:hypothetical protein